jgi:F420-non-reducing hydrogenase iron-sulfur subunit
MLRRLVQDLGIHPNRLRLEWISASEGDKVRSVVNEMVEQVRALGPLDVPGKAAGWDQELSTLQDSVCAAETAEEAVHA